MKWRGQKVPKTCGVEELDCGIPLVVHFFHARNSVKLLNNIVIFVINRARSVSQRQWKSKRILPFIIQLQNKAISYYFHITLFLQYFLICSGPV